MGETYTKQFWCENCEWAVDVVIPKGYFPSRDKDDKLIAVDEETETKTEYLKCPQCGLNRYLKGWDFSSPACDAYKKSHRP